MFRDFNNEFFFTSDGYLYDKNCFSKLNFKSPISRQDFSSYLPVNKLVIGKVYFEKMIENTFKTIIYGFDGFIHDAYVRNRFDRNGFNINGIHQHGFNRNNYLA